MLFHVVLDKQHAKTVFENADDRDYFLKQGWIKEQNAVLIRGAGVDITRFKPRQNFGASSAEGPPIVMLLSRMLWDKGIGEFVEAARLLRHQCGVDYARFVLVGDPDDDNRGSITREQLQAWQQDGVVEWWGFHPDVAATLGQATISCLPSYREGLPKSLLESMAMGLPCIATDVPGCREAVIDNVNGYLVPARDSVSLAKAIERLLNDKEAQQQFGVASRAMAVNAFSKEMINEQTLSLYDRITAENC